MKQTNNAIKFLMAQYRAIFKNAYFKGMATALVLTAGLAAGAAQAATEGYLYRNSKWDNNNTPSEHIDINAILAGQVAGDALASDALDDRKQSTTASGGTLTIGTRTSGAGTQYMQNGTAAGNWAEASGSGVNVTATSGSVTVNSNGYVLKSTGARGVIYGGRASSLAGSATATYNKVLVKRNANLSTPAASNAIRGAHAHGFTGATANNNIVEISSYTNGSTTTRQAIAVQGATDLNAGTAVIASVTENELANATGKYEASNNDITLTSVSATSPDKALDFVAGKVGLGIKSKYASGAYGVAENNHFKMTDGIINTSGGYLRANWITNASGAGTASIDGKGRGIEIVDSEISTKATTTLSLIVNDVDHLGTGTVKADNGRISIDHTQISDGVNVIGSKVSTKGVTTSASNNEVSITEESTNYDAKTKTYKQSVNADITGATVTNNGTANKLVITATGNSIDVGSAVSVTGDVVGASVNASGSKIATMSLNDNSVSVAGKVVGNIKAVSYTNSDTGGSSIDAKKNKLSFLNNDVSGAFIKSVHRHKYQL